MIRVLIFNTLVKVCFPVQACLQLKVYNILYAWRLRIEMDNMDNSYELADSHSLRGRVFGRLREDILLGKYKDKEELKEVVIGKELGVSRTPVREALRQLELEGLVTIIPNKGAYVTGISDKDVNDIFMIRSYLEGLCAAWACENITEEQLEEMEESVFLAEFHAEKEHFEQVVELDNKFHKILYHACGSRVLSKLLVDYHHYAQKVRKVNLSEEKRAKHSILEHKRIVEAIRNKNVKAAEEYAHDHIMESIKRMHDAEADVK